jgi:Xaa-Pro aminopeptidase
MLQAGGTPHHTVVACGRQGSDPNERGHGPLLANEPIVIHIHPRSLRTGYFGDLIRTVVRGRATDFVRGMFVAVREAHEAAVQLARHGTSAAEVHGAVEGVFKRRRFKTSRRNGHMEGFFYGTGHGIGLEIHETPRVSARSRETLRAGHVVALEPGLYYPAVGGVHLNEVVLITNGPPKNLSKISD